MRDEVSLGFFLKSQKRRKRRKEPLLGFIPWFNFSGQLTHPFPIPIFFKTPPSNENIHVNTDRDYQNFEKT